MHRAIARRQTEAGMQDGPSGLRDLAIEPHDKKLARRYAGIGRERPLSRRAIGPKVKLRKALCRRSRVINFNPRVALAEIVGWPREILRLHLIQPNGGEGRQNGAYR